MHNQQPVKLTIDGQEYLLGYDFNAIADTEREAGCNLLSGLMNIGNMSAKQLSGLFLAGIRAADPKSKMTTADVNALVNYQTLFPISEALAESILRSLPDSDVPTKKTPLAMPTRGVRATRKR